MDVARLVEQNSCLGVGTTGQGECVKAQSKFIGDSPGRWSQSMTQASLAASQCRIEVEEHWPRSHTQRESELELA